MIVRAIMPESTEKGVRAIGVGEFRISSASQRIREYRYESASH